MGSCVSKGINLKGRLTRAGATSGSHCTEVSMPKVLLVEDNEMNRDMLSRRLVRRGFDVLIAVDGEEGVRIAKSEMPDLILMDMSLPVLDGWEATRRIKAEPS